MKDIKNIIISLLYLKMIEKVNMNPKKSSTFNTTKYVDSINMKGSPYY